MKNIFKIQLYLQKICKNRNIAASYKCTLNNGTLKSKHTKLMCRNEYRNTI